MTGELKEKGWIINHKKVYRLMKASRLLYGGRIRVEPFKRDFIRFRSLQPERPLQYLSMDIKYVHIHGSSRNALLLTIMDIYSRKVLIHTLRHNIKKGDVSNTEVTGPPITGDAGPAKTAHAGPTTISFETEVTGPVYV